MRSSTPANDTYISLHLPYRPADPAPRRPCPRCGAHDLWHSAICTVCGADPQGRPTAPRP